MIYFDLNIKIESIKSNSSDKSLDSSNFYKKTEIEIPDLGLHVKRIKK